MPFFNKNEKEIVNKALDELDQRTNITQLAPGSTARVLLEIISREQSLQFDTFDINMMQVFIRYAEGRFLDLFGDMFDLRRIPSQSAEAIGDNLMFYVSSGTFGNINSGYSFTIPAGTLVETVQFESSVTPGLESQPVIKYVTTEDVSCNSTASYAYAPIKAEFEGTKSNVPRNVLNKHYFSGYADTSNNSLKCTNRYAISNGIDREGDQSYRYRLSEVFRSRQLAVQSAIRLSALSVPGVASIRTVNCEQGPGTFSLYVNSLTPTTSPNLLAQVASNVNEVVSYGVRPFVLAPNPVGVELFVTINWASSAKQKEIDQGYVDVRNNIEEFFNNTKLGQDVELLELIDLIIRSSSKIVSVGSAKPNQFDGVFINKADTETGQTVRSQVFSDKIETLYNEKVVLETSTKYRGIKFITG